MHGRAHCKHTKNMIALKCCQIGAMEQALRTCLLMVLKGPRVGDPVPTNVNGGPYQS